MEQTKLESLKEVTVGSVLNVGVAFIFNLTLLPILMGVPVGLLLGLEVTAIYTGVSMLIRYLVRRYYNAQVRHKMFDMRRGGGSIQGIRGRVSLSTLPVPYKDTDADATRGDDRSRIGPTQPEAGVRPNKIFRKRPTQRGQRNRTYVIDDEGISKELREEDDVHDHK